MSSTRMSTPRLQRGSTLSEVLVSIVILSLGLLGLVSSLVTSLWQQRTAGAQLTATQLAQSLGDYARSNPMGLSTGGFNWQRSYLSEDDPPTTACGVADPCSPMALAQARLGTWLDDVRTILPQGDAYVVQAAVPGFLDVWVMWGRGPSKGENLTKALCPSEAVSHLPENGWPECAYFRVRI